MPDGCKLISPNGRCDLGVIKTAIWYETEPQQLKIKIFEARALKPRSKGGSADPYVKIYIIPDKHKVTKQKTEAARRTLDPIYNQLFSFDIPHEELYSKTIHIAVWDNSLLKNKEMGFGVADVWTVPWNVEKEDHAVVWYALQPKVSVVMASQLSFSLFMRSDFFILPGIFFKTRFDTKGLEGGTRKK